MMNFSFQGENDQKVCTEKEMENDQAIDLSVKNTYFREDHHKHQQNAESREGIFSCIEAYKKTNAKILPTPDKISYEGSNNIHELVESNNRNKFDGGNYQQKDMDIMDFDENGRVSFNTNEVTSTKVYNCVTKGDNCYELHSGVESLKGDNYDTTGDNCEGMGAKDGNNAEELFKGDNSNNRTEMADFVGGSCDDRSEILPFVSEEDLMKYYSDLTRHIVDNEFNRSGENTDNKSKPKSRRCDICGKMFSETYNLNLHMKLHTGENLHRCDICGKMFTLQSNLSAHLRLHSGIKPYKCDVCGNDYNQAGDLKRHQRTHSGERPYICQICGKSFMRAEHCKTHQTVHTGAKKHTCEVCGRTFSHISHLRVHARIHSGDKPFHCEICGKEFAHSSDRNKHAVVHSAEKPHKCQYCDKTFARKDCKNRHEKTHFKMQEQMPMQKS